MHGGTGAGGVLTPPRELPPPDLERPSASLWDGPAPAARQPSDRANDHAATGPTGSPSRRIIVPTAVAAVAVVLALMVWWIVPGGAPRTPAVSGLGWVGAGAAGDAAIRAGMSQTGQLSGPAATVPTTAPTIPAVFAPAAAPASSPPTSPVAGPSVPAPSAPAPVSVPAVPAQVSQIAAEIIAAIDQQSGGRLHIPQSADNLLLLGTWMANEGGLWANNPLNTTLDAGRYPHQFSAGGVDSGSPIYPTMHDGIVATAKTLLDNPAYGHILRVLSSGSASCLSFADAVIRSPWAASHYGYDPAGFCGASPASALGHGHRTGRPDHPGRPGRPGRAGHLRVRR